LRVLALGLGVGAHLQALGTPAWWAWRAPPGTRRTWGAHRCRHRHPRALGCRCRVRGWGL